MSNKGRQGEQLFIQRAAERGYAVQDVSSNPDYWYKDIDVFLTSPTSGATKSFEIKWDSRINRTGNLYIEISNVHSKGGKGWFTFCEADMLAYGNAATQQFYIIDMEQLRQRVEQLPRRMAQCGSDSIGLLVSLDDIKDIVKTF